MHIAMKNIYNLIHSPGFWGCSCPFALTHNQHQQHNLVNTTFDHFYTTKLSASSAVSFISLMARLWLCALENSPSLSVVITVPIN